MKPQPEIAQKIRSWKDSIQLVQWVSSVYKYNAIGTWNLPGAVGILRDQAEELPLHQSQPLTLGLAPIT